jgi:hypothetical protein
MTDALTDFWDSAIALTLRHGRPRTVMLAGAGSGALVVAVLDALAPWGGVLHVADPAPVFAPPVDAAALRRQAGDRLVLHPARPRDAAALMPVADLLLIDAEPTWQEVSGVLHAMRGQTVRTGKQFPLTLIAHVAGGRARHDSGQEGLAAEPRSGVLTALEDFVADQAPEFAFTTLPFRTGLGVLYPHEAAAREDVQALLAAIAMGPAARQAAAEQAAAGAALAADIAVLRRDLEAERHRNGLLNEALAAARAEAAPSARAPAPGLRAARRAARIMLSAAGLRRGGQAGDAGQVQAEIARLRASPILDADWYRRQYTDVALAGTDPALHYYETGAAEGRDPGPAFSTSFYLARHPDVAASGVNPLLHYLASGAAEGRDPSPDFSSRAYLTAYPDVEAAGLNPLEHYVSQGRAEGRQPSAAA